MKFRSLFVGRKEPSLRVVGIAVAALVVASVPIILRVDTVFHSLRWYLWGGLIVLSLGLAGYAGRKGGGLLGGWFAVFLAVLWLYIATPLVAYLQGGSTGEREYAVLRPSVVRVDPYAELMLGLRYGPILGLLVALTLGSTAFIFGKYTHRVLPSD